MSFCAWDWRAVVGAAGALYVHIPFCVRKCAYCDFASWGVCMQDERIVAYVRALQMQIEELASVGLLDASATGYVGGGTPSMLGASVLASLLLSMRKAAPGMRELTCEANPDTLSNEVLTAVREAGATRLSIGVQSLADDELLALGRLHNAARAIDRVRAAVASGLDVSVDLMCATPRQSDTSWACTLETICHTGVGHVSVYPLQLEPDTPLAERFAADEPPWNDEEVQASRMEAAHDALGEAGLVRYEVASYARPGEQCLHNTAYWTGIPYLSVGHGAAGMLDRVAYERLRSISGQLPLLEGWVQRIRLRVETPWERIANDPSLGSVEFDLELLDDRQALAEDLMLGMRLTQGIGGSLMNEARHTFGDAFRRAIDQLVYDGLVAYDHERLVPTHLGWLLGNEVFGALWSLSDA